MVMVLLDVSCAWMLVSGEISNKSVVRRDKMGLGMSGFLLHVKVESTLTIRRFEWCKPIETTELLVSLAHRL